MIRTARRAVLSSSLVLFAIGVLALQAAGAVAGARPVGGTAAGQAPVSASTVSRGARLVPRSVPAGIHAALASRASSSAVSIAAPLASSHEGSERVPVNFDGVGSLDSAVTNFGAEFEPPDQGLCVGNGFVLEMVNSAYRVYDMHGNTIAGPTNVNVPFHDGLAQFTSDPRCFYDKTTNTWFAVILFLNDTFTGSDLQVAVNTSGDPSTAWSVFNIDTTDANAPANFGCPCFGDQPTLGYDANNLYTTTNEFSILGPEYNGAHIYAISKHDLVKNAAKVHFVDYFGMMSGGALAASIQPATTIGSAPAEYFLSSLDPNGAGDNRLGVWALTKTNRVSSGGTPILSSLVIGSEAYAIPPGAAQLGSSSLINPDDDRMQATEFINGSIWGALDTQVTPAGDVAPRAGAAWFRVTPHLAGHVLGSATLNAQGYVTSSGGYLLYPAIAVNAEGQAAMVFTETSSTQYPSAAYAMLGEEGRFGRPHVVAAGTGSYDPAAGRWGDYSWAVLDPSGSSVWMATEYMPPVASQTLDGLRNWGTRVFKLNFSD